MSVLDTTDTAALLEILRPRIGDPWMMQRLTRSLHEHLIDAMQAGRADSAYEYARLLAYVAPRA